MDTRLTTTHETTWRMLISALAVALPMTLGATATTAASPTACSVQNTDSGRAYTRLQTAVDAAKPGAHLVVKGTCHGGTFIDEDLAIRGVRSERRGKPVLDGDKKTRVLTVKPKVEASIRSVVIRDGLRLGSSPSGGGITNKGRLTLRDVVLRDNLSSTDGSAVFNRGVLRTWDRTLIWGNQGGTGHALYNTGHATLGGTTRISRNFGCLRNLGVLVMNDSSSIDTCWSYKGVDVLWNEGSLVMSDSSSIWSTGGVINRGALTLNDGSRIHDNYNRVYMTLSSRGGGVYNEGTLTMTGTSSIDHNRVQGFVATPGLGGGVYNMGTLSMADASRIHSNGPADHAGATVQGGGLYNASGGTLIGVYCAPHTYANVFGNTPDDCYFEP